MCIGWAYAKGIHNVLRTMWNAIGIWGEFLFRMRGTGLCRHRISAGLVRPHDPAAAPAQQQNDSRGVRRAGPAVPVGFNLGASRYGAAGYRFKRCRSGGVHRVLAGDAGGVLDAPDRHLTAGEWGVLIKQRFGVLYAESETSNRCHPERSRRTCFCI